MSVARTWPARKCNSLTPSRASGRVALAVSRRGSADRFLAVAPMIWRHTKVVIDKSQLAAILRIGHDSSMRGEGISLQDAIARSGYVEIRNKFGPLDLVPLLREKPELMMQWVMFSEDKRTGGYWISEATNEVGLTLSQQPAIKYGSVEEAVSRF